MIILLKGIDKIISALRVGFLSGESAGLLNCLVGYRVIDRPTNESKFLH